MVDYRELVEDPAAAIESLYRRSRPTDDTGVPGRLLEAETTRARKHVSGHSYSLEEFGLEADSIQTRLADLYEQYGWERDLTRRFDMNGDTADELRSAWNDFIAELEKARDAIDQPDLLPAPANDRNLAEGYRYLMGYVHSAIERAFFSDPRFPVFRHAIQVVNKATIDNADAIYFFAPIDGRQHYILRGSAPATTATGAASPRRPPAARRRNT